LILTGKTGYTRTRGRRTRIYPTRPETSTRPDPYPRVLVGSAIPAGTGGRTPLLDRLDERNKQICRPDGRTNGWTDNGHCTTAKTALIH